MAALTEAEIFDMMTENLKKAAESCDTLAVSPYNGPTYRALRSQLELVEGACRQAAAWRDDTRWLPIGLMMAECHKMSGSWLRGKKDTLTNRRTPLAPTEKHVRFVKLAEKLREIRVIAEKYRTDKTGHMGLIMPDTPSVPRLILPPGARVQ